MFGVAIACRVAGGIAAPTANAAATGNIADDASGYRRVFGYGLAVAVAFAPARPRVRRLMHGVH